MIAGIIAGARQAGIIDGSEVPHRYWRVRIFASSSNVASIANMQFRETIGGADVAAGNTLITSGSWTSAANVFDGNDTSFGYTSSTANRNNTYSIGMDFGASSGNWRVIREILIRNGNSGTGQGATGLSVEYSDDNATWQQAWSAATADWSTIQNRVISKAAMPWTVFSAIGAATDTGPFATALAASGNAAIASGRFTFDGAGDFYSNGAVDPNIGKLGWKTTVEVLGLKAASSGFKGVVNVGGAGTRFLMAVSGSAFEIWESATQRLSVASMTSPTVAHDFKVQIEGTTLRFYRDNVLEATSIFNTGVLANAIWLGTDPADSGARSLNGSFDGVRITHGLI